MALTYWDRDQKAAIFQKTFSNAFSWMKMYKFRLRFQGSNWQHSSICSDNGLVPVRRQAIIWTNDDEFTVAYMPHSASMSLDKFRQFRQTAVWVSAWINNYTPKKTVLVITYPCPNIRSTMSAKRGESLMNSQSREVPYIIFNRFEIWQYIWLIINIQTVTLTLPSWIDVILPWRIS